MLRPGATDPILVSTQTFIDIPNDATIVILGRDMSQCLLLRKRLQALGLKIFKEFERGSDALRFFQGRSVDLIYVAGRPMDMDPLTFIRSARSGKGHVVAPIVLLASPGTAFSRDERSFFDSYHVSLLDAQTTDERRLSQSLRSVFVNKMDGRTLQARLERAKNHMLAGMTQTAATIYREVLEDAERNIVARVGLVHTDTPDPKEQWQHLKTLIMQDPKNYCFRFELIERCIQDGRLVQARAMLDAVYDELDQSSEVFWLNELGIVCVGLHLYPVCRRIAERLKAMASTSQAWLAPMLVARIQLGVGNTTDAERHLAEAERLTSGKHAEIENLRAILARRQGDLTGAIAGFARALTLSPDDHRVAYNLGLCHEEGGDGDAARRYFKLALQLSPHFDKAKAHLV